MAEIRTATTLRSKADEISAAIVRYEHLLRAARQDLMHVQATLAIFEGADKPEEHKVYVDLRRVFRHGEIAGHVLAILKEHGASDTVEIARHIGVLKGLDTCDGAMMRTLGGSVLHSLKGLRKRGKVVQTGKAGGKSKRRCQWALQNATGAA